MMGGTWFQEVFGAPENVKEERLLSKAIEAVRCHLGVTAAPSWSRVSVHRVRNVHWRSKSAPLIPCCYNSLVILPRTVYLSIIKDIIGE